MKKVLDVKTVVTFVGDEEVLRALQEDLKTGKDVTQTYKGHAYCVFESQQSIEVKKDIKGRIIIAGQLIDDNYMENVVIGDASGEWFFVKEAFYEIENEVLWVEVS